MGLGQSQQQKMDHAIFELRTVKVTLRNNIQKLRKEQKAIFQRAIQCDISIEEDMLIEQACMCQYNILKQTLVLDQTESRIQEIQNMNVENTLDDVYLTMAFNRKIEDGCVSDEQDCPLPHKDEVLEEYRKDMMLKLRQARNVRKFQKNVPQIPKHRSINVN